MTFFRNQALPTTSLLILLSFPSSIGAASQSSSTDLATYEIPGLTVAVDSSKRSYKGQFYELGEGLIAKTDIKLKVFSPKRVVFKFKRGKILGFYPALKELLTDIPFKVCKTREFAHKKDFIFYKKGHKASTVAELKGKTVGITIGYSFSKEITEQKDFAISEAFSDESNFKQLALGRIDYFIVEEITGLTALKKLNLKGITYDKSSPISRHPAYFAFNDTVEGKKACKLVDKRLAEFQKSKRWDFNKLVGHVKNSLKMGKQLSRPLFTSDR